MPQVAFTKALTYGPYLWTSSEGVGVEQRIVWGVWEVPQNCSINLQSVASRQLQG